MLRNDLSLKGKHRTCTLHALYWYSTTYSEIVKTINQLQAHTVRHTSYYRPMVDTSSLPPNWPELLEQSLILISILLISLLSLNITISNPNQSNNSNTEVVTKEQEEEVRQDPTFPAFLNTHCTVQ